MTIKQKRSLFFHALAAAIVYAGLLSGVFGMLAVKQSALLDTKLFIPGDTFYSLVAIQAESKLWYFLFHRLDALFILLFYSLLVRFSYLAKHAGRLLWCVALGAGISDILENWLIDFLVLYYPKRSPVLAFIAQGATGIKFFLLLIWAVLFLSQYLSKKEK